MTNDALIFDIDGTLWNASAATAKGWNLGLESMGIDRRVTPEEIERVTGNPYERCVDILLPGLRERNSGLLDLLDSYEARVVASDGGNFYDGVIDGIFRLAGVCKVFIVSNCQEWYLDVFLRFSRLAPVLSGADCHGISGMAKNDMLSSMQRDHALQHPVYIGDTAQDGREAALAGISFIHVAWGFGEPEDGAQRVHSFTELLDYVGLRKEQKELNRSL